MRLGLFMRSFLIVVLLLSVSAIRAENHPWPQTLDCRRLLGGLSSHGDTVQKIMRAEQALETNWKSLAAGGYNQSRGHRLGAQSYAGHLGSDYVDAVESLNPRRRWLDLGSGYANAPLHILREFGKDAGEIVSLAYKFPGDLNREELLKEFPGQLLFVESLAETISPQTLGQFNLITSVGGAFTYGTHIDIIIFQALRSLVVGGKFLSHHPTPDGEAKVIYGSDLKYFSDWSLPAYLQTIRGAKFSFGRGNHTFGLPFVLERTADPLYVPPLFLASYDLTKPPIKKYVVTTEEEAEQILNAGPYSKRFSPEEKRR